MFSYELVLQEQCTHSTIAEGSTNRKLVLSSGDSEQDTIFVIHVNDGALGSGISY